MQYCAIGTGIGAGNNYMGGAGTAVYQDCTGGKWEFVQVLGHSNSVGNEPAQNLCVKNGVVDVANSNLGTKLGGRSPTSPPANIPSERSG